MARDLLKKKHLSDGLSGGYLYMSFLHYLHSLWSIIFSFLIYSIKSGIKEKLCIALIITCTFYLILILYVISKTNVKASGLSAGEKYAGH